MQRPASAEQLERTSRRCVWAGMFQVLSQRARVQRCSTRDRRKRLWLQRGRGTVTGNGFSVDVEKYKYYIFMRLGE